MIEDCTGLVLAGGASRRMGEDKTKLELGGTTLLQRVIDLMHVVFPRVLVSVRESRSDIAEPQVLDVCPDGGPLAGLCAGLASAETPWVFAVAANMPYLNPDVIRNLAARRDSFQAVVPVIQGVPQPLAAFYAVTALPTMRMVLAEPGKHSLRSVLERLHVCLVHESRFQDVDPGLRSFIDLDTPDDVAAARRNEWKVSQ